MSNNLFSVFEPSAILGLSLNWISLSCFLLIPVCLQVKPFNSLGAISALSGAVRDNTKETLSSRANPASGIVLTGLLIWVALNNFLGLGPYLFTASSHLVFGMVLALSLWIGYMAIYTLYFNDEIIRHLIPSGTPVALVGLIILIEFVRRIIRPATLIFRLTANIIAGHLLLVLLSRRAPCASSAVMVAVLGSLILLLALEVGVSFIQAYVFYLLTSLYLSDLVTSPSRARDQVSSQTL